MPGQQVPLAHRSPKVQGSPSSQGRLLFVKSHVPPEQESLVQGFPSSQTFGTPTQRRPEHVSGAVHGSPSSQLSVLGV